MFADDCSLQISLNGVKAISKLVEKKKAYVPAQLISTLLFLNIKVFLGVFCVENKFF